METPMVCDKLSCENSEMDKSERFLLKIKLILCLNEF